MWKSIEGAEHLYELEKIEPSGWCWRSLAVRLTDGTFLVVSPIRGSLTALDALGKPSFALAPNHYHHLGLPELRAKFPELRCIASEAAKERLVSQRGHAFEALDAVRDRLPEGVELLAPEGLKS